MNPFTNPKSKRDQFYSNKGTADLISIVQVQCPHCNREHILEGQAILVRDNSVLKCKGCGLRYPIKHYIKNKFELNDTMHIARSIGVCMSKGGVGKTTTAINLSAGLAKAGFKVLLIDTDTQGQDSYALGIKQPQMGLSDYLIDKPPIQEASIVARENLWLLAGGKSLSKITRMIDQKEYGGEMVLSEALSPLESSFDYIIIDTSPGWHSLAINVLFYVKEILTPVSLNAMSLQGLIEFFKSLNSIQKYRKDITLKYVLPTVFNKNIYSQNKVLKELNQLYKDILCAPIRFDPHVAKSPAFGKTICEYAPNSVSSIDYKKLIHKVIDDNEYQKIGYKHTKPALLS